jgi:hypothetical protein
MVQEMGDDNSIWNEIGSFSSWDIHDSMENGFN